MFSYTIQIQDLFLFIYIFIYLFFVENSLISFCFQLISGQYKHSTSTCNLKFRNAMQIPSGMLTGPVQADFPVLISTLFALLLSNLWFTSQILGNYSHSQQVCMFCCKAASNLCPVLTFAPLFLVIKWPSTPFWESSCKQFVPEIAPWKKSNMEKGPKKRPYMQKEPIHAKSAHGRFLNLFN